MNRIATRLVVLFAIVALVIGSLPAGSAEAASKKSKKKTIVVTTQEELVAALKKYGSSNSKVKIKIETTEASTFTLSAKYSSDSIQIVVDAPNATIKSKAKVSSITINEAKSVKEYASGNKITVNDEKLTFTAMENASVEKLTIASETGTVKVVNNGGIEKVAVKSEVKVDLTQNGEMGRVYVGAAADISVSGTSEESLKVTVQKDAVGASVKSEVPVSVNAYADVDLTLEKGAESSKVTMKEETAGVKLENKTEETISVKDTEGNTQKVETGEDLTTDNFVGKPDEPETPEGGDGTVTEQPKDEEKKEEEKKEEEKDTAGDKEEQNKDNTGSESGNTGSESGNTGNESGNTGSESGNTGSESGNTGNEGGNTGNEGGNTGETEEVPTETDLFAEALKAAAKTASDNGYSELVAVRRTTDLTLTADITVPRGVYLFIGDDSSNAKLDAGSFKITLKEDARINVSSESKLIVAAKNVVYAPDRKDTWTGACIEVEPGSEFKYGGVLFTVDSTNPGFINWFGYTDKHYYEDQSVNKNSREISNYFSGVEIVNNGGTITMSGDPNVGFDAVTDIFGVDNYIFNEAGNRDNYETARNNLVEDETLSSLNFTYHRDVRFREFITKFNDNDKKYEWTISDTDWLNALLDPERDEEVEEARAANIFPSLFVVKSDEGEIRTVTIPSDNSNGAAISITGELRIPVGSKLITNIPLDMYEYGAVLKIMGTFESQVNYYDGLGVHSSVIGSSKEKAGVPHLIVEMCGPQARLILKESSEYREYFFNYSYSDGEVNYDKIDPEQQGLAIETWRDEVDGNTYIKSIWEYIYIPEDTTKGTPHWMVYRKTKGAADTTGVEVVNHPFKDNFISLEDLRKGIDIGVIDNRHELVRFLDWSSSVAWLYAEEKLETVKTSDGGIDLDYSKLAENSFDGIDTYQNIGWHKFTTNSEMYLTLPAVTSSDGNLIPWELGAVELTVNNYSAGEYCSMRLRQGASLKVSMGGTLVVESVTADSKNSNYLNQKALVLDYDENASQQQNNARIDVCLGGALQIGDIKVSVPDNRSGDPDKGQPGISLSAEYDGTRTEDSSQNIFKGYLRLQVPECAKFTTVSTGETATAAEVNQWMYDNNISFDIACDEEARENGTEHVKVSEDIYWFVERAPGGEKNNTIREVKVPGIDDGYYNVTTEDELVAVYLKVKGTDGEENVRIKIAPLESLDPESNRLSLRKKLEAGWTILVPADKVFKIDPGSLLKASVVTVASRGAIEIGYDIVTDNDGNQVVRNGALSIPDDGRIVVEAEGRLTVCGEEVNGERIGGAIFVSDTDQISVAENATYEMNGVIRNPGGLSRPGNG